MDKNIHEDCGVALIRLLKPLEYYQQKYGTWMWALNKLYLMMEKEHNRGQEGAGIAAVKLESEPGHSICSVSARKERMPSLRFSATYAANLPNILRIR